MISKIGKEGFIPRLISSNTIQSNCKKQLNEIIQIINKRYGKSIHSIYLYGSFSRGDGVFKKSDLDLFVVTSKKIDLPALEKELTLKYKNYFVDMNFLSEDKEVTLQDKYGWMAFLHLFCVCVHGEDLVKKTENYKVTNELIKGFVEETEKVLDKYRKEASIQSMERLAKRIIRSVYYSSLNEHMKWTTIVEEQAQVIKEMLPEHQKRIDLILEVGKGKKEMNLKELDELVSSLEKISLDKIKEIANNKTSPS